MTSSRAKIALITSIAAKRTKNFLLCSSSVTKNQLDDLSYKMSTKCFLLVDVYTTQLTVNIAARRRWADLNGFTMKLRWMIISSLFFFLYRLRWTLTWFWKKSASLENFSWRIICSSACRCFTELLTRCHTFSPRELLTTGWRHSNFYVTDWIFYRETFRRCLVPECESLENGKYDSDWVKDVLPGSISDSYGHFVPEICSKYAFNNDSSYNGNQSHCAARWFDHEQEKCNKWIFDKTERTIVNDVSQHKMCTHVMI